MITVKVTDRGGLVASQTASPGALMVRAFFAAGGFSGTGLDQISGIAMAESWSSVAKTGGFIDAVGDLTLVDAKWGPSVGLVQIRTLKDPYAWGALDRWRDAKKLKDPLFYAQAAYALSKQGTDFTAWSVFKNNNPTYLANVGKDFQLRVGHERALSWPAT